MIEVDIKRAWQDYRATLGMLRVRNVIHDPLFTLENPDRENDKSGGDSLIYAGEYICHPYSSEKYPNVWQVMNVPDRSLILFHWGNWESDTEGCILLGLKSGVSINPKTGKLEPSVQDSVNAIIKFRKIIGNNAFKLRIG